MADEYSGISVWQKDITSVINDTYSYANNSLFYACIPSYYRQWAWRYLRPSCEWLDGYVSRLHDAQKGIISTRIANALITGITKTVIGEKLLFKTNTVNDDPKHELLHFVCEWAEKNNIKKSVYSAVGFALANGTSLVKLNKTMEGEIWWEAVRFDRCFYTSDFKGNVKDATFFIRNYTDTRKDSAGQFILVEHRFYKHSDGKISPDGQVIEEKGKSYPYVEFAVKHVKGTMMNETMLDGTIETKYDWAQLPQTIRDAINEDYSTIRIGEEQRLPFTNIGVEVLQNGEIDLGVPSASQLGASLIVPIQDDLITYDIASSYLIRDMYLGKGTVYQPKSLSMGDFDKNPLSNVGDSKIEIMNGVDPDKQKTQIVQFDIREASWQVVKENCLRNIATKWGVSPKLLNSYLATSQKTATQVDSEDDDTIAFIYHSRSYFTYALNQLLKTTLNFYGKPAEINLTFATPSLINKDRIIERNARLLEIGLIDEEEAIRNIYPDADEEDIQRKISIAKENAHKREMSQFTEFNQNGTFDDDSDLGTDNLDGTSMYSGTDSIGQIEGKDKIDVELLTLQNEYDSMFEMFDLNKYPALWFNFDNLDIKKKALKEAINNHCYIEDTKYGIYFMQEGI